MAKYVLVNVVTCLRFPLAAVTAWAMWRHEYTLAAASLATGLVSDWVDGALARALKAETKFGAEWLEPAADITLMVGAVIGLALIGLIPWWMLATLAISDRLINWAVKPRVSRPDCILLFQAIVLEGTVAAILAYLFYHVNPLLPLFAAGVAPFIIYLKRRRIAQFVRFCFRK